LANDLRPSRALGQNFVADGNTVRRIVRLAGVTEGRRVIEIGAGLGSLTLALAEAGASVTAVEIDRHVLPVLRAQVEPFGVRVVEADALRVDWSELLATAPTDTPVAGAAPPAAATEEGAATQGAPTDDSWALVANLPYNVAVPLVIKVLEEAPQVSTLLVMVQREVGERLAASAGDEAYGAVSVKVAYWATAAMVGRVSASVFIPMPRVESVLVRLDRRPGRRPGPDGTGGVVGPGAPEYERLFSVVRGGFAHRRKMLRRSLDGLVRPEAFEATGIRATARAEELPLGDWERLAAWEPGGPGRNGHPANGRPGDR
jgi:16S rRNA (adenine1518-N6/adenine1519-N6)-dimethyltransferase